MSAPEGLTTAWLILDEMWTNLASAFSTYEGCLTSMDGPLTTMVMYMTPEELEEWAQAEEEEMEVCAHLAELLDEYQARGENPERPSTAAEILLEKAQQAQNISVAGRRIPELLRARARIVDAVTNRFESESGDTWKDQQY
jgi:hypothetical protein